jgi:hypothetical protein
MFSLGSGSFYVLLTLLEECFIPAFLQLNPTYSLGFSLKAFPNHQTRGKLPFSVSLLVPNTSAFRALTSLEMKEGPENGSKGSE